MNWWYPVSWNTNQFDSLCGYTQIRDETDFRGSNCCVQTRWLELTVIELSLRITLYLGLPWLSHAEFWFILTHMKEQHSKLSTRQQAFSLATLSLSLCVGISQWADYRMNIAYITITLRLIYLYEPHYLDTIIQFLVQSQMLRISLEDWAGGKSLLIGKSSALQFLHFLSHDSIPTMYCC